MWHQISLKKSAVILITVGLVWFLFKESFSAYFFQDDWFSLFISRAQTPLQFLSFFFPRNDLIYYRPLGMQIPFFIIQSLFEINPLPFRIVTFIIHLLNSFLVYKILQRFAFREKTAVIGAILYATSSIHLTIFYWAATFAFVLGPFLYFSSFLCYLNKRKSLSIFLFLIGLLTNELIITLPAILLFWNVFLNQIPKWKVIIPYVILSLVYVVFRLTLAKASIGGDYGLINDVVPLLKNGRDYVLWSLNWPEEIHNQFISFLKLQPLFISQFLKHIMIFIVNSLGMLIFFFISLRLNFQKTLFGIAWFFIALLPILFFSQHAYAYYLPIPFLGFLLLIIPAIEKLMYSPQHVLYHKILLLIAFMSVWYASSLQNIEFNTYVHWVPRRAEISRRIIDQIQTKYPIIPGKSIVIIPKKDEHQLVLSDQNALKVIYNDASIEAFYGTKTDLENHFAGQNVSFDEIRERIKEIE